MYTIYAIKLQGSEQTMGVQMHECTTLLEAADRCIALHVTGHRLEQVMGPNGRLVEGEVLMKALLIGVHSVRAVLRE